MEMVDISETKQLQEVHSRANTSLAVRILWSQFYHLLQEYLRATIHQLYPPQHEVLDCIFNTALLTWQPPQLIVRRVQIAPQARKRANPFQPWIAYISRYRPVCRIKRHHGILHFIPA
jgi:hypothetical protein